MRAFESMIRPGRVSAWIGRITSEDQIVSYVDEGQFARDFDFEYNPWGRRGMVAESHAVPVSQLVKGFSRWEQYEQELVAAASRAGFHEANSMLIVYAFEYVPSVNVNPNSELKFVGAFNF